jgi:AcrR family transcriptional regulator
MVRDRREQLLEGAVEYVLRYGVGDLTLRPLAAHLGTSDRMLVYHFGGKEPLVDQLLRLAYDRCIDELDRHRKPAATPGAAIRRLWQVLNAPQMTPYLRLYLEVAALSLHRPERHREASRMMLERWRGVITQWLVDAGAQPSRAGAVATVLSGALDGLQLDLMTTGEERRVRRALERLAAWVDETVGDG